MTRDPRPTSAALSREGHAAAEALARHAPAAAAPGALARTLAASVAARLGQDGGRFGRFSALRLLGGGGLGVVYAAWDDELGREVALKVLRHDGGQARLRLWREAVTLAGIEHPNVLGVYDLGWVDGACFIVTELARHGTLADWLVRPRGLTEVLDRFGQAARGLAAVHALGLVHRDVKPANLFVGEDGRVLVGDFGLVARRGTRAEAGAGPQPLFAELTADGTRLGTAGFAAPEQWEGLPVDAAADQYGLAVSLLRTLVGPEPEPGAVAAGARAPLSRAGERLPDALWPVLARALAPAPADRYAEMGELAQALESLADRGLARRARRASLALLLPGLAGLLLWLGHALS